MKGKVKSVDTDRVLENYVISKYTEGYTIHGDKRYYTDRDTCNREGVCD